MSEPRREVIWLGSQPDAEAWAARYAAANPSFIAEVAVEQIDFSPEAE